MNSEVLKYVNERQLSSVMNKTKWCELEKALNGSEDFIPYVRYKLIYDENPNADFTAVWWHELLEIAETIEWLEIDPFKREWLGRLVADRVTDFSDVVSAQLTQYSIPYSIENGMFRIWGYLRRDESPEFI
ncbi:DUF6678 family protein [Shewanella sp. ISTPL2]|uniref:DUF6678 family protein n=1 Tax=Shewanella sp. ISTPL2 TaxID=2699425 RepID=UPI00156900A9|nr:DUF6678 family protein [Shewanella sp. ISTPL2]